MVLNKERCYFMKKDSKMSYLLEIREFRKDLRKIVIPYEEFVNVSKDYNNNIQSSELVGSNI